MRGREVRGQKIGGGERQMRGQGGKGERREEKRREEKRGGQNREKKNRETKQVQKRVEVRLDVDVTDDKGHSWGCLEVAITVALRSQNKFI